MSFWKGSVFLLAFWSLALFFLVRSKRQTVLLPSSVWSSSVFCWKKKITKITKERKLWGGKVTSTPEEIGHKAYVNKILLFFFPHLKCQRSSKEGNFWLIKRTKMWILLQNASSMPPPLRKSYLHSVIWVQMSKHVYVFLH